MSYGPQPEHGVEPDCEECGEPMSDCICEEVCEDCGEIESECTCDLEEDEDAYIPL